MTPPHRNNNLKIIAVILFVITAGYFVMAQYRRANPDLRENLQQAREAAAREAPQGAPETGPPQMGPPSEEEREQMREELFANVGITQQQREEIARLEKTLEGADFRTRMQTLREVLTPEQQKQAREVMMGHFEQRMAERTKMLPESEQENFRQKMQARRDQMMNGERPRWAPEGGPPPGEGPPPPPDN